MNKIDIEFSALIKTVKEMEKDELFHLIKNNFFKRGLRKCKIKIQKGM